MTNDCIPGMIGFCVVCCWLLVGSSGRVAVSPFCSRTESILAHPASPSLQPIRTPRTAPSLPAKYGLASVRSPARHEAGITGSGAASALEATQPSRPRALFARSEEATMQTGPPPRLRAGARGNRLQEIQQAGERGTTRRPDRRAAAVRPACGPTPAMHGRAVTECTVMRDKCARSSGRRANRPACLAEKDRRAGACRPPSQRQPAHQSHTPSQSLMGGGGVNAYLIFRFALSSRLTSGTGSTVRDEHRGRQGQA